MLIQECATLSKVTTSQCLIAPHFTKSIRQPATPLTLIFRQTMEVLREPLKAPAYHLSLPTQDASHISRIL